MEDGRMDDFKSERSILDIYYPRWMSRRKWLEVG